MNEREQKIIESLTTKVSKNPTYANESKLTHAIKSYKQNELDRQHSERVKKLNSKYDIPAKERVTYEDLFIMIDMVLETGESGTKVIRRYAKNYDKSKKWIDDIAKQKTNDTFKNVLQKYKENAFIKSMKKESEKDILKSTITGALRKLANQRNESKKYDDLASENALLAKNLARKSTGEGWDKELAQELRDSGKSLKYIAKMTGVSKSNVAKYTKPRAA